MAEPVRHRRTKGAATDTFSLQQPRHTSTLPNQTFLRDFVRADGGPQVAGIIGCFYKLKLQHPQFIGFWPPATRTESLKLIRSG